MCLCSKTLKGGASWVKGWVPQKGGVGEGREGGGLEPSYELGYIFRTLSVIVNSDLSRHIHVLLTDIQPYCCIFRTLCNSCKFSTLSYLESWHIQNLRYIQNSVMAHSEIFRTLCNAEILRSLPYSEFWHIQDLRHNQIPVYIGLFRHIQ